MSNRRKANSPGGGWVPETGAVTIGVPPDDCVILKEVPAKVKGTIVGKAIITEDANVYLVINDDVPVSVARMLQAEMSHYSMAVKNGPA